MTPVEKKELISELSGVLASVIERKLAPIQSSVNQAVQRIEGLERQQTTGLRDARAEVAKSSNDIKVSTHDTVLAAVRHLSTSLESVASDLQSVKEQIQPRSIVEVRDERGSTSMRPASLVAAESSIRTENAQQGIAKVVLDAALDTTQAKNSAAAAKKRSTATLVTMLVQAIIVGIWGAWQAIQHFSPVVK